jgi:hypothetical protein
MPLNPTGTPPKTDDGLLQIRGPVPGGQIGIRSSEVIFGICPLFRFRPTNHTVGAEGARPWV